MVSTISTIVKWLWVGLRHKHYEGKEPVVRIHLVENGFYAEPEDIFSHPNVPKQLKLLERLIEEQNQETSGKGAAGNSD